MNKALANYECDGQMSFTDPASFLEYMKEFQEVKPATENVGLVLFFDQNRRLKGCNKNAAARIPGPKYGIRTEDMEIANSILSLPYYLQKRFLNAVAIKM